MDNMPELYRLMGFGQRREEPVVVEIISEEEPNFESTGDAEADLKKIHESGCGKVKYTEEYELQHNCKIVAIPRKKADSSWLSFMAPSVETLTDVDGKNFVEDMRIIERESQNSSIDDIDVNGVDYPDIHLFLNTSGGRLATAELIVKTILRYPGTVHVFVDEQAMSAGTLIALCGHTINLRLYGHLGQIDPQIGYAGTWFPTNSIASQNVNDYETNWVRDAIRYASQPCLSANQRVSDILDKISDVRGWSDLFLQGIRSNLLEKTFDHDKPYDYDDLMEFWISSDHHHPDLRSAWPESAEFLYDKNCNRERKSSNRSWSWFFTN